MRLSCSDLRIYTRIYIPVCVHYVLSPASGAALQHSTACSHQRGSGAEAEGQCGDN